MRLSLEWLDSIIPIGNNDPDYIADGLTSVGIEVEAVENQAKTFDNIIVGQIETKDKHPNADKLSLLSVNVGSEKLQIVCGAQNMKQGDKVAVSLVGATLPNGLTIKKSKIRGVESCGMCCSLAELGLGDDHAGIIILDESAPVGKKFSEVHNLNDVFIDIAIPPNRGDVISHLGVAREVAAFTKNKIKYEYKEVKSTAKGTGGLSIKIDDSRCNRYIGRLFKGVTVKSSPKWLSKRLEAVGIRPINNLVDITNYLMFELGHPLHVFDAKHVSNNSIIVRQAKEGEEIVLLDESKKKLSSSDMLIADDKTAIAIAGVMGGEHSGVEDDTQDVILECAYFEPAAVRVTAKRHNISTDSSYRFERGADFANMLNVVHRASELIKELCEPKEIYDLIDVVSKEIKEKSLSVNIDKLNSFLGVELNKNQILSYLEDLNFKVKVNGNDLAITTPIYRNDISLEADIYEEVARQYGLDNIPSILPPVNLDTTFIDNSNTLDDSIRDILKSLGYLEAMSYSFVPDSYHKMLNISDDKVVSVMNPITETMKVMRVNLIPSMMETIRYNFNHRNMNLKLFEIGRTYMKTDNTGKPSPDKSVTNETNYLCACYTGNISDTENWVLASQGTMKNKASFYDLKGEVEAMLKQIKVPNFMFIEPGKGTLPKYFHPGMSSIIKCCGRDSGYIGKVHPDFLELFDLENEEIFIVELNLDTLANTCNSSLIYKDIAKFPNIRRDISFVVSDEVRNSDIEKAVNKLKIADLAEYGVFDLFTGKGIDKGFKSLAYYFIFNNKDRTLEDKEVDTHMELILSALRKEFSIEIR
jgi:phenylalanyl-tRNA synthetase beta chain